MAMIRDILFDVAPEFETADTAELARVDRFIGYAAGEINRGVWGGHADMATALLAAHKLALRGRVAGGDGTGSAAAGPVKRRRNGDFEEEYAVTAGSSGGASGSMSATPYGAEYERLLRALPITPRVL
jgi:hypothetical protein